MTSLSFARAAAVPTYDRVAGQSAALVIRGYSTSFGVASWLLAEPVRTHVRNAMAKVGARSRAQLVAKALGEGHALG